MIIEEHNGVKISFDEDRHKYFTDKVDNFTSATTFIHTFFKQFEKGKIAKAYAAKRGISVNKVLIDWQEKSDTSIILGNMVHKFCEEKLLNQDYTVLPIIEKQRKHISVADKCVDKLLSKFELVATEKIIFSEKYKLAGTIDLIMKYKDNIILLDWKTNKEIVCENRYNNYGLGCLSHLDDNNYTQYQLQLNMYKWLLLEEGYYDCNIKMKIVHFSEDRYRFYDVKDLQSEINEIVKTK